MGDSKYKIFGNNFITNRNGDIFLDEVPAKAISERFQTPLFIYLKKRIKQNIHFIKRFANDYFNSYKIFYSVKSNYIPDILRIIGDEKVPFEIISEYEYEILKKEKLDTENIIVGGPCLTKDLIFNVLNSKNSLITVYSTTDLRRIGEILAARRNKDNKLLLRINNSLFPGNLGILLNEKMIKEIKDITIQFPDLNIIGLHSHYSTQMNDFNKYKINAKFLSKSAKILEDKGILKPLVFNFGGGFPIASQFKEKHLKKVFRIIKEELISKGYHNSETVFELGRYIVGDAGCCMMKVINIVEKDNLYDNTFINNFINNDGAIKNLATKKIFKHYKKPKNSKNCKYIKNDIKNVTLVNRTKSNFRKKNSKSKKK
ncbi:MAG: hypothetical protein ACTSRZ_00205 [Promethearchaeota archaeon]